MKKYREPCFLTVEENSKYGKGKTTMYAVMLDENGSLSEFTSGGGAVCSIMF
jgi:hypothetical protein